MASTSSNLYRVAKLKDEIDKNANSALGVFGLAFGYLLGGLLVWFFSTYNVPWFLAGPGIFFGVFVTMVMSLVGLYREERRLKSELSDLLEEMGPPSTM